MVQSVDKSKTVFAFIGLKDAVMFLLFLMQKTGESGQEVVRSERELQT